jgi:hypothetical protein
MQRLLGLPAKHRREFGTSDLCDVLTYARSRKGEDVVDDGAELLNRAIDQFQSEQTDATISVGRVINPLLGIWKLANEVDHVVAVPIEQFLTALAGRNITTPLEIATAMDETRQALALLTAV